MAKKGGKNKKAKKVKKVMTNAEFAEKNELFIKSVELAQRTNDGAKVNATTRQASKWRNQKGFVYKHSKGLI